MLPHKKILSIPRYFNQAHSLAIRLSLAFALAIGLVVQPQLAIAEKTETTQKLKSAPKSTATKASTAPQKPKAQKTKAKTASPAKPQPKPQTLEIKKTERPSIRPVIPAALLGLSLVSGVTVAASQSNTITVAQTGQHDGDDRLIQLREAFLRNDQVEFQRIFSQSDQAPLKEHPLYPYVQHWTLRLKLSQRPIAEANADALQREVLRFLARHDGESLGEQLRKTYIEKQRPSPFDVAFGAGLSGLIAMMKINPFETLWQAVSRHLKDPRLQQLFGRYATYVGSSPYQAVATLLLIAHVEQEGVWTVQGGMHAVARAFERVFKNKGGSIRYETSVRRIVTSGDCVRAVITAQGEEIPCRAVISNADANAIATGHFGDDVSYVVQELNKADRSLSAITWCSHAHTSGFPLAFHNVFFSKEYKREFEMLRQSYPPDPTTYICAQDRNGIVQDKERLLILINSPANGDSLEKNRDMIEQAMRKKLNECGFLQRAARFMAVLHMDFMRPSNDPERRQKYPASFSLAEARIPVLACPWPPIQGVLQQTR